MTPPFTRIDPDFPLCWEDADTLRVGFERAAARVRLPSAGTQRLIGSLRNGIPRDRLPREARRLGATPQELRDLLVTLDPVLTVESSTDGNVAAATPPAQRDDPSQSLRVYVSDNDRQVSGFSTALRSTGLLLAENAEVVPHSAAREAGASRAGLVIYIERFLEPLEHAQRWLSMGVPHLLIGFSDRSIRVGPLVQQDGAPCHTCATLATLATDSALPVLAAQLAGTRASSESEAGSLIAATWASVMIRNWVAGATDVHTTRTIFSVVHGRPTGAVQAETVVPHPDCACSAASSQSPLPR